MSKAVSREITSNYPRELSPFPLSRAHAEQLIKLYLLLDKMMSHIGYTVALSVVMVVLYLSLKIYSPALSAIALLFTMFWPAPAGIMTVNRAGRLGAWSHLRTLGWSLAFLMGPTLILAVFWGVGLQRVVIGELKLYISDLSKERGYTVEFFNEKLDEWEESCV